MSVPRKSKKRTVLTPTEAILESISDGVFTVDKDWCISSFNRAAEEITGVPRKEAIGRPKDRLVLPVLRDVLKVIREEQDT